MKKAFIYTILVILLIIFVFRTDFDFSVISKITAPDFLLLSAILLLSYANTFYAVDYQFRMMKVFESRSNIALLCLAGNLMNYLPARAGMISLGTFLKVKKNVPVNLFVFTTVLIYMLVALISVLLSFLFIFDDKMLVFYSKINFNFLLLAAACVMTGLAAAVYLASKNRDNVLSRYFLMFIRNRKLINENKMNLFYSALVILGGIILFSLRMYISFDIAGHEISLYHAFMIGVIANLSFFLSFTPGGLGVKEGFIAGVSYILFGDASLGVVASLIDRAVNLLYTIITGSMAIKIIDKRFFSEKTEGK
ncbi:MAG TPA: lysylphosphatidylglycerol synthase domain-containing protein [Clostridiales bacterium]|jgi:uncharacterized membrane protein YbhN (UPF0104 family)|nr:lysylphosphatidylglycerol synthase domain-containing protein [Clostridiales bacterium]HQP69222.1 lysylphosphatidylglycerol synthase domain-containing protein [Clostridiales bacterium]